MLCLKESWKPRRVLCKTAPVRGLRRPEGDAALGSPDGSVEIRITRPMFEKWLLTSSRSGNSYPCGMFLLHMVTDINSSWQFVLLSCRKIE